MRTSAYLLILCIGSAPVLACQASRPTSEPNPAIVASEPEPEPKPEPEPPSEPEPEPEPPSEPEPSMATPDGCQVLLIIESDAANGRFAKPVTLTAKAKNLTEAPLELTMPDRCPGGEVNFSGLEPGEGSYDYYRTCNMGACAGGRPSVVIALPPGEVVQVGGAEIHPDGKRPCNEAIATGSYSLSFTLPLEGSNNPVVCGPEPIELRRG